MLLAIGAFLVNTHQHEPWPDPDRPWLQQSATTEACPPCRKLATALGLELPAAHREGT
jgi:hypothetical protein